MEIDEPIASIESPVEDLLALDEALTRFEQQWPDKAKLVKLKYFAGMTIPGGFQNDENLDGDGGAILEVRPGLAAFTVERR